MHLIWQPVNVATLRKWRDLDAMRNGVRR